MHSLPIRNKCVILNVIFIIVLQTYQIEVSRLKENVAEEEIQYTDLCKKQWGSKYNHLHEQLKRKENE
jgi:hypothetical protein